jgi:hypothetical protein
MLPYASQQLCRGARRALAAAQLAEAGAGLTGMPVLLVAERRYAEEAAADVGVGPVGQPPASLGACVADGLAVGINMLLTQVWAQQERRQEGQLRQAYADLTYADIC